jgi:ATP-dependent DNA ligase
MLTKTTGEVPGPGALQGGCQYEPKWDGYRGVVHVLDDRCVIRSRRGSDLTDAFPDIAAAARAQLPPGSVIDGELVIWGEGRLDFAAVQARVTSRTRAAALATAQPASFVAFDVLTHAGVDVRGHPLSARRRLLEDVFTATTPPLQLSPSTLDLEQARTWLADYTTSRVGIEGLVIKGLATAYRGDERGWLKYRIRDTTDVLLGAVTGTLGRPDRLIIGRPGPDRTLTVAGGTTSLTAAQRDQITPLLHPATDQPWPT